MIGKFVESMKPKLILCLALVLGNGIFSDAGTILIDAANLPDGEIISPQESVYLPGLGSSTFSKQSSGFSFQVPVGFRKDGAKISASNTRSN
jgi:hypothetical protein